jgi:hypothetical protein
VEISSKLGTITIPKKLRNKLRFTKGAFSKTGATGFRERVLSFTGHIPDVREVLKRIIYHTKIDESLQYKNQQNGRCSRPCFLEDIAGPAFLNAKETTGCEQLCSTLIYARVNKFNSSVYTEDVSGVYLDSLVISLNDHGTSSIGLSALNNLQLYSIYSLAINDRHCTVFAGEDSDGCRARCANSVLSNGCALTYTDKFDISANAGTPFDLHKNITRQYLEDDIEAVKLGGMVVKPTDMYDSRYGLKSDESVCAMFSLSLSLTLTLFLSLSLSLSLALALSYCSFQPQLSRSRIECRSLLASELADRGLDSYVPASWLPDCPLVSVRISALKGEVMCR